MNDKMRVFISQPMTGLSESEIIETRNKEKENIRIYIRDNYDKDAIFIPTYYDDDSRTWLKQTYDDNRNWDLFWLSQSIEALSHADILCLCDDWEYSKGCNIELKCASAYRIPISYPPERRANGK